MNEINDRLLITILTQIAGQAPALLAYLIGAIVALTLWRRSPGPALLTLIAMVLLLVTTLVQAVLIQVLVRASADAPIRLGWLLSANAFIGSLMRALATGLLLAAVFSGRRGPQGRRNPAPPDVLPVEEDRITQRTRV